MRSASRFFAGGGICPFATNGAKLCPDVLFYLRRESVFKIFSYFQMSVFCFFKFFNRRSLSHTIHGIFLHMKLRPVLRFFLILDKNAPVFYRWKICPHIRFFPAKFFFFFYRHICSVIPWGNACEAAEIIDYINSSAPVSSFKTALACNIFCKSSARFRAAI